MKISIGMCTFKRQFLSKTLDSIFVQEYSKQVEICEIIVVDNDIEQSARSIVNDFSERNNYKIKYINEPEKNISAARNKILENVTGEWLLLIDDDEVASPNLLQSYINAANTRDAAVFFGPVVPVYPSNTPEWIKKGDFFNRPMHEDGIARMTGGAGNAFINMSVINKYDQRFSKVYGLTGGEDSHFFYRLFKRGEKLLWVANALAEEYVEPSRVNREYLEKLKYRVGQTYSRYRLEDASSMYKSKFFIYNLSKYLSSFFVALIIGVFFKKNIVNKVREIKWRLKAKDAFGKMHGLLSNRFVEMYGSKEK